MRYLLLAISLFCAGLCSFALSVNAQQSALPTRDRRANPVVVVVGQVGAVSLAVVSTSARITYRAAKFVAKDIAKPIAVHMIEPGARKVLPPVGRFAVRNALRLGVPLALRLGLF